MALSFVQRHNGRPSPPARSGAPVTAKSRTATSRTARSPRTSDCSALRRRSGATRPERADPPLPIPRSTHLLFPRKVRKARRPRSDALDITPVGVLLSRGFQSLAVQPKNPALARLKADSAPSAGRRSHLRSCQIKTRGARSDAFDNTPVGGASIPGVSVPCGTIENPRSSAVEGRFFSIRCEEVSSPLMSGRNAKGSGPAWSPPDGSLSHLNFWPLPAQRRPEGRREPAPPSLGSCRSAGTEAA